MAREILKLVLVTSLGYFFFTITGGRVLVMAIQVTAIGGRCKAPAEGHDSIG